MPSNRLVNATQSPRCRHIKVNGTRCGSPARHGRDFCCFHDSAARRNGDFVLPIVEDAASLQLALNKIMQALVDKLIDQKTASILLYGLQIAASNLKQLRTEQIHQDLDRILRKQAQPEPEETRDSEADSTQIPFPIAHENQLPQSESESRLAQDRPIPRSPDPPIAHERRFNIEACTAEIEDVVRRSPPRRTEFSPAPLSARRRQGLRYPAPRRRAPSGWRLVKRTSGTN